MTLDVINLRSDTQTLPTAEMLDAICHAPLGDDTYREDPTVTKFQEMVAQKLGMEAALLTISGHMANLIALMVHARPGQEVVLDRESHIFCYEVGSMAGVAGLMPMPIASHDGMLDPDEVRAEIRVNDLHAPEPRLLCLENTHNRSGGRVIPVDLHRRLYELAQEFGMAVHVDGARIFDAAIGANAAVTDFTQYADSLMFCLSKGLSCPLGSVLAGSRAFIDQAERARKQLGGGMRQAGIIAAAGIVGLETMIDRLADDHALAKVLAKGMNDLPGFSVDPDSIETNMIYIDHTASGMSTKQVLDCCRRAGVLFSSRPPTHIRAVVNRHHDAAMIEEALRRLREAPPEAIPEA
jgi:threonine aldolase